MTDRYALRHSGHGKYIDVVHAWAEPQTPALARFINYKGWEGRAEHYANLVCRLLNDHARVIHQEEP